MPHPYNGMAARDLHGVAWQKSRHSNSQGTCVEFAKLPGGESPYGTRASRTGPRSSTRPRRWRRLLLGVKDGEFDHLVQD